MTFTWRPHPTHTNTYLLSAAGKDIAALCKERWGNSHPYSYTWKWHLIGRHQETHPLGPDFEYTTPQAQSKAQRKILDHIEQQAAFYGALQQTLNGVREVV